MAIIDPLISECKRYLACVNGGMAMEYLKIQTRIKIAEILDIEHDNPKLLKILHHLDTEINFPIEPLFPDDNHPYWKNPDRNLSDIALVNKYESKLCALLYKTFKGGKE